MTAPDAPPPIGARVSWSTFGGDTHAGVVTEIDNGDMVVMCDDGRERVVPRED